MTIQPSEYHQQLVTKLIATMNKTIDKVIDKVIDETKIRIITNQKPHLCMHRGSKVTRITCDTCKGHIDIFVFRCKLYNLCTIETPVTNVPKQCFVCPSYERRTS